MSSKKNTLFCTVPKSDTFPKERNPSSKCLGLQNDFFVANNNVVAKITILINSKTTTIVKI